MHLLNRSKQTSRGPAMVGLLPLVCLASMATAACYHPVDIALTPEQAKKYADSDSVEKARKKLPAKCTNFVLLVENALPRAVEIYEVGHTDDRFIAFAQVGITEVPMTEGTQQFVAMSRGEVMAAATNSDNRPGDRVALQRSCRQN